MNPSAATLSSLFHSFTWRKLSNKIAEIIKRIRALTFKLLPVQVELSTLSEPTSRVITPKVIEAYAKAAGDFGEAVCSSRKVGKHMLTYDLCVAAVLSTSCPPDLYLGTLFYKERIN